MAGLNQIKCNCCVYMQGPHPTRALEQQSKLTMSQLGMENKRGIQTDTALSVPEPKQQNRKMCLNLAAVPVTKPRHTHTSSTN